MRFSEEERKLGVDALPCHPRYLPVIPGAALVVPGIVRGEWRFIRRTILDRLRRPG